MWAAATEPGRVRSLVLIGPFVRAIKINPIMTTAFWLMMHNPWRVPAWAMYYRSIYPTRKPTDFQDYLRSLKKNLAQPGRFEAVTAIGNSSPAPSEDHLRDVKAPTLVVMGTKTRIFQIQQQKGDLSPSRHEAPWS